MILFRANIDHHRRCGEEVGLRARRLRVDIEREFARRPARDTLFARLVQGRDAFPNPDRAILKHAGQALSRARKTKSTRDFEAAHE